VLDDVVRHGCTVPEIDVVTGRQRAASALGQDGSVTEQWVGLARDLYDRAVFGGDAEALTQADEQLDQVEAGLCLARGRIAHARYLVNRVEQPHELELFERAAALFARCGAPNGEAEAVFWVGTWHQVVKGNHDAAVPALRRAVDLASAAGDGLTLSYALRHLAFAASAQGDASQAWQLMQESTDLRRQLGFWPGVAANMVALAYLAAESGRREDAGVLLDEAAALAAANGAEGVSQWVEQARHHLAVPFIPSERQSGRRRP
jgi:tetratricopeptide (TPR) repeat protein